MIANIYHYNLHKFNININKNTKFNKSIIQISLIAKLLHQQKNPDINVVENYTFTKRRIKVAKSTSKTPNILYV